MRVFITGGAGWVGSVTVSELLAHGHQVTALARTDKSADTLESLGAEVLRGDLEDIEILQTGAKNSDAIIHLAFASDNFDQMVRACEVEYAALSAIAQAISGTNKPLIMTSGTLAVADLSGTRNGEPADESTVPLRDTPPFSLRIKSEDMVKQLASQGIRGMVVRLSPVTHGKGDIRFIAIFGDMARRNGKAIYVGEGKTNWPAVHRLDAATLFRLAMQRGKAGSIHHATAE